MAENDVPHLPVNKAELAAPPSDAQPFKLRLSKPHLLIQRMMAPEPKPDHYGYSRRDDRPNIDIRVSKEQRRNALAIMDRLFKALEARDIKIVVPEGYGGRGETQAVQGPDKTQISLTEAYKKVEHVPTAKELREKEKTPFLSRIPKWDDVPTGKLTLHPGGPIDLSNEEAVQKLIAKAVADVEEQIAHARRRRKSEEEERHQAHLRQKAQEEEKARVAAFHQSAKALRQYRLLMDYIEEVRRFGRVPDDQRQEGQTLEEWIEWAQWQARRIHPIG